MRERTSALLPQRRVSAFLGLKLTWQSKSEQPVLAAAVFKESHYPYVWHSSEFAYP